VLTAPDGVIAGARPGTVAIDMSTITPDGARRIGRVLAERGVHMLDAPVTGGPAGAEAGTLTIMVGGDLAVLERMRPILNCLGARVIHVGPSGAGQVVKACNQLALLVNAEGVAEALSLGQRHGVDPRTVREVLMGGIAASRVLDVFGAKMAERQFTPGMQTRLYDKDMTIALDLAKEAGGRLPAAEVVRRHLDELMARGEGERDLATLITLLEG
jgi:2-hydroxy-3-oxopropionate reductase